MSDSPPIVNLVVEDTPNPDDVAYIDEQLNAFNIRTTGYDDYRPLAIFVRDAAGAIIAGLSGFTWGGALKIEILWVDARQRGQDLGTRLLQEAERQAVARGCQQAILDTHSFQAPDFYRRLGYIECGVADDWPVGYKQHFFTKRLV